MNIKNRTKNIKAEIIAHSRNIETGDELTEEKPEDKPEDKDYYIYKTTNIINGKFYIGKRHYRKRDEKWYLGSGIYLNRAIKKFGRENFKKEIIEWCSSSEEVNIREKFWINELDALNQEIAYNLAPGGEGGFLGEEACKKISAKLKGRKMPEGFGDKVSKALKGKKKSKEHIEKVRKALTGRKRTEKEKEDMSKSILKRYEEGFESPVQIPIYQYDIKTGDFINSFKSCAEASKVTGFDRKAINNACLGITKKSKNFIWSRAKFKNYYNRFSTIKAEIITHSKRPNTNEELVTYKLTYPRCIHSELMTYSMMSVNSASSRAIPVDKLIDVIEDTPFYPCYFQMQHKGMQGDVYADYSVEQKAFTAWNESLHNSIKVAKKLSKNVTKQLVNRILESYQYHCCLMTGTRESFNHLFNQRCPVYPGGYKSWKELCDLDSNYTMETPLIERLKVNKGQAEIHFMDLAEKMYDALNESTPDELPIGSYHIPFYKDIISSEGELSIDNLIAMSVALTARVSYTSIGDDNKLTLERATNIYNHCLENGHWSVFEHIGQCMTDEEYENSIRQIFGQSHNTKGWNKKFKGFKQLRATLELQLGIIK